MYNRSRWIKIVLASVIGALVFIGFWGSMNIIISAFEVNISINFSNFGYTRFVIPPIGYVQALTHFSPWGFTITLRNIDLERLTELISLIPKDAIFVNEIQTQLEQALKYFIAYLVLLSFFGGALGSFIIQPKKKINVVLIGGAIGLLLIIMLFIATWFSYNTKAFNRKPEFEGILDAAPWIFGLFEESIVMVDTLGERLSNIASNLYTLFERIENLEPLGTIDGDLKVLHVSDIHNNPAALRLIEQVIDVFAVDLVIDTGDITDYGTVLEAELASGISNFSVPYVLVPGNHDSPSVIKHLEQASNVIILEKGILEINGLIIAGISDPSAASTEIAVGGKEVYWQYAQELLTIIEKSDRVPHLLAVHHPVIAELLKESGISLALTGHTHKSDIIVDNGFITINAGTTGAAGIRGLEAHQEIPFSVVLIYFKKSEETFTLLAADLIKIFQFSSGFSINRVLLEDPLLVED